MRSGIALVLGLIALSGCTMQPEVRPPMRAWSGYCTLMAIPEEELVFAQTEEAAWNMVGRIAHCEISTTDARAARWGAIVMRLAVVNYLRQGWTEAACHERRHIEETILPRFTGEHYTQALLRRIHRGCP